MHWLVGQYGDDMPGVQKNILQIQLCVLCPQGKAFRIHTFFFERKVCLTLHAEQRG